MDAAQALADLTEISAQIEAAVLADHDGAVVASTLTDDQSAKSFAEAAAELLAAAASVRTEPGSEPLVQVEGVAHDGSVFVAKDDRHLVAAVTKPRPTVGLVFYDLKTCLRMLERQEEAKAAKETKTVTRKRTTRKKTEEAAGEGS
ncbi:MAG TPA: roadblock/LC7 domain-containing protein [Gaiellaceae bacterium]|jgi:predicted regulator of Ras-like GTPase activity (Roadblock/LC7/MglB family)